jgi:hypothetical protein
MLGFYLSRDMYLHAKQASLSSLLPIGQTMWPVRDNMKLSPRLGPGNTNGKGMLSTVDLLIKVTCFIRKQIMFEISKAVDVN